MTLNELIQQLLNTDLSLDNSATAPKPNGSFESTFQDKLIAVELKKFTKAADDSLDYAVGSFTSSGHYLNVGIGGNDIRYEMLKDDLPDVLPSSIYAYSFSFDKTEYILFSIEGSQYVGVGYWEDRA